jgi:peptidylprolyl isomerase/FKBP-type peptidyl-prolyl cis-trans isomerase SlpA
VQYKLFSVDNRLLYESEEPLTFTVGEDDILPAFEANLMGLSAGDKHRFTLSPEEAYGAYQEELVFTLSRQQLMDDGEDIVPGQTLTLFTPEGESILVTVLGVTDNTIKVDANHPLAGQTLIYEVEVLNVV